MSEITRQFVRDLAAEHGLGVRILSTDETWTAEITVPEGRQSDGSGLLLMYAAWNGTWQSGNGVTLAPHDVRRYLQSVTSARPGRTP